MTAAIKSQYHHDRKYNVVVYGIEDCPKCTPKHAWSQSDLKSVISLLSGVDNSIQSQFIA